MIGTFYSKHLDTFAEGKIISISPLFQSITDWIPVTKEQADLFYRGTTMPEGKRRKVGTLEIEDVPLESLSAIKSRKIDEIRKACGSEIDSGFEIDALNLGYDVHYRTNRDDQERIRNAKDNVNGGKIWYGEVLQFHTQEQAQEVWNKWLLHSDECSEKYAGLFTQIKDATESDREWLENLTW